MDCAAARGEHSRYGGPAWCAGLRSFGAKPKRINPRPGVARFCGPVPALGERIGPARLGPEAAPGAFRPGWPDPQPRKPPESTGCCRRSRGRCVRAPIEGAHPMATKGTKPKTTKKRTGKTTKKATPRGPAKKAVRTSLLDAAAIDPALTASIRASILLAGPMLARSSELKLPPPGGDVIGRRRLDTHFDALRVLGAEVEVGLGEEVPEADGL